MIAHPRGGGRRPARRQRSLARPVLVSSESPATDGGAQARTHRSGDPKVGFSSRTVTYVQGILSHVYLDLDEYVLKYKIFVIGSR